LCPGGFTDPAAVLVEGDIPDPVETILNGPVTSGQLHDARWRGFLGSKAGNPVDDFGAFFVGSEVCGVALDAKDLFGVGKMRIIGEFRAGPDVTYLQSTMTLIDGCVLRGEKS
jgi:hypothetical protein